MDSAGGALLLLLFLAFASYVAYEWWATFTGRRPDLTREQVRRRVLGAALLLIDLLLWLLYEPLIRPLPVRVRLVYLLAGVVLAVAAILVALREATAVLRQYSRQRRALIREMLPRSEHSEPPAEPPSE